MNIIGVHFDSPFLRMSRIRKTRKSIEIVWTQSISLSEEPNVKQLYNENFKGKVVSGLRAKDFLIRPLDLSLPSKHHLEETIAFQADALSHFNPQEVLTIPIVEMREKDKMGGVVLTVPKMNLKNHLEELGKMGIDPQIVSTVPSALTHYIQWKFPTLSDAFIIDLGSQEITCVHMEKGKLKKAHGIPLGIEDLLNALYEDRKRILLKKEIEGAAKQIDLLLLKSQLNPKLSEELFSLKQELAKIYFSFTRGDTPPVIFTGRSDAFLHLREFLISFQDDWKLTLEEQKEAISVGLCIEQTKSLSLQLRREEFFPKKNWAQMGKIALCLCAASLFISFSLLAFGIRAKNRNQKQMLVSLYGKNGVTSMDEWIKTIENNNREYPYISTAPKVSEVLSWLSSHPLFEESKREGDPIDIREIRVQLVNFPSIFSENEPYLVKVELDFKFKSPMKARKFHEMLRAGDDWVDSSQEITWDTSNESYRTSFYLNNRSPYVP